MASTKKEAEVKDIITYEVIMNTADALGEPAIERAKELFDTSSVYSADHLYLKHKEEPYLVMKVGLKPLGNTMIFTATISKSYRKQDEIMDEAQFASSKYTDQPLRQNPAGNVCWALEKKPNFVTLMNDLHHYFTFWVKAGGTAEA